MNTFEKHLKEKMSGQETLPSQDSFNTVLQKIQAQKRKKRLLFFYYASGVAAILIAALFAVYISNSPEQLLVKKETPATTTITKVQGATTAESVKTKSKQTTYNSSAKNNDSHLSQLAIAPTPVQIKTSNASSKNNSLLAPANSDATGEPSTSITSSQIILSKPTKPINAKSFDYSKSNSGSASSANADFVSSSATPANEDSLIYLDSHPFNVFPTPDNSLSFTDNLTTEKKLLLIKSKALQPKFFVDISYLLLTYTYQFEVNTIANIHPTGYTSNFNGFYLQNKNEQNRYYAQNAPSLKFGATLRNRFELSVQAGYRNFVSNEIIHVPAVDTTKTPGNAPGVITPGNVPGITIYATSLPTTANELDGMKVKNSMKYLNTGFNFAAILRLRHFQLKPGFNVSINRLINADYVLLDANGYELQHKSTRFLNRNLYTLAFKAGLCKHLTPRFSIQAAPLYQISTNTFFDSGYFIKQKARGFGLESSVIYHF